MLSNPIENIKSEYEAVVIGSGYGGGISASRLSRAGFNVCVLERGKEFIAGEFPDTPSQAARELQTSTKGLHVGNKLGLFDFHYFDDISVFQGCGLGGTSLVNANVSLRLDERVFEDPSWPSELIDDMSTLNECYGIAESMLKPETLPEEHENLKKYQAHKKSAQAVKSHPDFSHAEFKKTPINVTFEDKINHVGVEQAACNMCGDCVSGCNYTSKNTTAMNYIPDAKNHGAEIFCEISVKYIEKDGDDWLVHYHSSHLGRDKFDAPTEFIRAKVVVLGAGTLGSTEILLRSKEKGLQVSSEIGKHFSGNGDVLAFAYNNDEEINGIGMGDHDPEKMDPVGPCITSVIDCRNSPNMEEGFVIEEGSIPGALGSVLPEALSAAAAVFGEDTDSGFMDGLRENYRSMLSLTRGPYQGAVDNTQTYLVMSHDGSEGKISLNDGKVDISWPGLGDRPLLDKYAEAMKEGTKPLGGTYLKNPLSNKLTKENQVTVHPLGGCCMGDNADKGVVNHKGQVFSSGTDIHKGLYVSDGSVLPRSVGVNPLLTISAVTERMCRYLVKDYKGIDIPLEFNQNGTIAYPSNDKVGIRFTEKMAGFFSKGDLSYEDAYEKGKKEATGDFEFVLTIISRDVDGMINSPEHAAGMFGTVLAPALSPDPLTAKDGVFQLFVEDENDPSTLYMRYNMKLLSSSGEKYHFEGHKVIHDNFGFDLWDDTTTLFITVTNEADNSVVGKGILKIKPNDFRKQMTTVSAVNGKTFAERMGAITKFSTFFTKKLNSIYM